MAVSYYKVLIPQGSWIN